MENYIIYSIGKTEAGKVKDATILNDKNAWMYMREADDVTSIIVACEKWYAPSCGHSLQDVQIIYFNKLNCFVAYDEQVSRLLETKFGLENKNYPKRIAVSPTIVQSFIRDMSIDQQKQIATYFNEPYTLFDKTNTIKSIHERNHHIRSTDHHVFSAAICL